MNNGMPRWLLIITFPAWVFLFGISILMMLVPD